MYALRFNQILAPVLVEIFQFLFWLCLISFALQIMMIIWLHLVRWSHELRNPHATSRWTKVSRCKTITGLFVVYIICSQQPTCLQIFADICRCFQIFADVFRCFQMFADICGCLKMFADVWRCFQIFADVCRCFQICADFCRCLQMFAVSCTSLQMLEDVCICWHGSFENVALIPRA